MYTLITLLVIAGVVTALFFLYKNYQEVFNFYISGFDAGFSLLDLRILWKVALECQLSQPTSLFWSIPELSKCMANLKYKEEHDVTGQVLRIQGMLSKLFDYRTRLQNESDSKKGLESSRYLDKGQKLKIILPGKGVFLSEIIEIGNELVCTVPRQENGQIPIPAEGWVGKVLNVYLWRKGDARYVFDTTVLQSGVFLGKSSISLKHSYEMVRTQKRKAIRARCNISASLYIIDSDNADYYSVESRQGYRTILEDISEAGALIRAGGKAIDDAHLKIQFKINSMTIVMAGVSRHIEYDEQKHQSLIHFECTHIDPLMRNEVLAFVYNALPVGEKEVAKALMMMDKEEEAEQTKSEAQSEEPLVPQLAEYEPPVIDDEDLVDEGINVF